MKLLILTLIFSLASCGEAQNLAPTAAVAAGGSGEGPKGDKGEGCVSSIVYEDDGEIVKGVDIICGNQDPVFIPKGEKGDKGDKGEQGIAGQDGLDGTNGIDGINGTNGVDGADGEDAHALVLINMAGDEIGQVYWLNASNGDYWVVTDDGARLEVDQTEGWFPNAYLLYAGPNCTGERRVAITNGVFANVFIDGRDNTTLVKAIGPNLGSFTYQSRVPFSNSCQNTAGTSLVSNASEDWVNPFGAYPLGRMLIKN